MDDVFWLASYPKSGNTWLRIFLANFLADPAGPVGINEDQPQILIASDRNTFDLITGVEASDLRREEIETYRPRVFELLAERVNETLFVKIHDRLWTSSGNPIASPKITSGVVYVLRNPLDIIVSYAHAVNSPIDEIITHMADESFTISDRHEGLSDQLPQRLSSWSEHVTSWVDQEIMPVHVSHYEEMFHQPFETFTDIVRFIGLPENPERIQKAIQFSNFSVLQNQERIFGFREKHVSSGAFFRKGQVGTWREILTDAQRDRVVNDHREVMKRFGYLSSDDQIIY